MSTVQTTLRTGTRLIQSVGAELVIIGIGRNALGRPARLFVRTGTHLDPRIGWTRPQVREGIETRPAREAGQPPPAPESAVKEPLAREVLWATVDLVRGERLLIHAKPDQHDFFQWDAFGLDEHGFTVTTGPVVSFPSAGKEAGRRQEKWLYDIRLDSPKLSRPLVLDPVIIIEEDP